MPLVPCCNEVKKDQKITVGCLLKHAYVKEIKWPTAFSDVKFLPGTNSYPTISIMTLNSENMKKKALTCSAHYQDKQITTSIPDCMGRSVKIPHIEILMPPFSDGLDANILLVCYVSDFVPKDIQVVWLQNGKEHASNQNRFKALSGEDGLYSGTTKLNVIRESWKQGDTYTCKVDIRGEVLMHNISKCSGSFVKPVANLELPPTKDLINGNGQVICSVLGTNLDTYKIFLNFDDQDSNASKVSGSKENVVIYSRNVTQDLWKSVKKVSCVAQSTCPINKAEVSKEVDHIPVQISAPRIKMIASCENEKERTSTLFCLVSDFYPHDASIAWLKNGLMLADKGKDFSAMLNRKKNMYFGKSEMSIKGNVNDTYTCRVTHQDKVYLQNVNICSVCKNFFKDPVIDLTLPSSEDALKGNAKIICKIQVNNLDATQVSLKLNNKDKKVESKFAKPDNLKDVYTVTYTVTKDELKGINTVTCVVKQPCSDGPAEMSKKLDKIIEPRSPDIQTSSGNTDMVTGTIILLCTVSNYWPQNVKLVWVKNGKRLDEKDIELEPNKQENGLCSGKNFLTVTIESWNKDTYECHVTHQNKNFTKAVKKPQVPDGDIIKPSFRDLFLYKTAIVFCRTNMVYADIIWTLNGSTRKEETKKEIIHNNTTWTQYAMTISLREWMEMTTLSCKINPPQDHLQKKMTIVRVKDDMKSPTIHLLPPDQESTGNLTLICLVMDFYPEDLFVTWKINSSLTEEDMPNSGQVNCNHNIKQCTAISQLIIQKSEWLKGTIYSCLVGHISSDVYIMKNISGVSNKSERDIKEKLFSGSLLSKNPTINCRTNLGISDIDWLLNETEISSPRKRTDEQMLYKNMESVQVTIQIPLEEWKTYPTQCCNEEFYNTTDPNMIKSPKVYLLPPAMESIEEDYLTLICLVNGFYPEDVFVTWKINGTTIKQDFPQPKEVICDPQKHLCSYVSHISILKEEWLGGMGYACLVAHFSSKSYIHFHFSKPNDIHTVYQDDGGEELGELEEINNMWTTTLTYIVLFLVTLIYSSFVTFVKVK
ncbi:uncharacterized protein LOC130277034 [Hyla sarda]|uniref:uncharacterized protein LOC130277034 n=1 Tax=Hyla sarda TaxID=327740 RepID=UPI0024C3AC00|nr:uncharacterized protein LOC130277034 [Hyla sarda]